jgi:ABC-type phosphonate transport system ATPase subunit
MRKPIDKNWATKEEPYSIRGKTSNTETIAAAGKVEPELAEIVQSPDGGEPELSPLFSDETQRELRTEWHEIQTGFVDEPRRAVKQADELVARLMQQLAQGFSDQRNSLERQWERAEKISTEDLRLALRRYRSFFQRLLSI